MFSSNFRTTRWEEMRGRHFRFWFPSATSGSQEMSALRNFRPELLEDTPELPEARREAVFWRRVCEFADETSTLRRLSSRPRGSHAKGWRSSGDA